MAKSGTESGAMSGGKPGTKSRAESGAKSNYRVRDERHE
jgi:hypothetical protein